MSHLEKKGASTILEDAELAAVALTGVFESAGITKESATALAGEVQETIDGHLNAQATKVNNTLASLSRVNESLTEELEKVKTLDDTTIDTTIDTTLEAVAESTHGIIADAIVEWIDEHRNSLQAVAESEIHAKFLGDVRAVAESCGMGHLASPAISHELRQANEEIVGLKSVVEDLHDKVNKHELDNIFEDATKGLSITSKDKLRRVMEGTKYASLEDMKISLSTMVDFRKSRDAGKSTSGKLAAVSESDNSTGIVEDQTDVTGLTVQQLTIRALKGQRV